MEIGKLFHQARKELELSQEVLSHSLECSQSALSKIENGILIPTLDHYRILRRMVKESPLVSKDLHDSFLNHVDEVAAQ